MFTRSHSIHRLALGLLLLGLAACGADATSEEPSVPDAGGTGLTGDIGTTGDETFTDALAGALCDWMLGCCTTSELDDFVAGLATTSGDAETLQLALDLRSDPEACRSLAKGLIVDTLRHADAAVLSGRATFNESAAAECLAHFEGGCGLGDAENIASPDHPCSPDRIVAGQVEAGLLCTDHFECQDTAFCDVAFGASFGTCRPWTATGAPCNQDAACGPSGYCGNAGTMGVCVASSGTLAPYCNSHGDCDAGQYCATAVGSCVDALTDGAVCQDDVFCSSGLCALGTTQTCEAPGGLNELCTRDGDCGETGYCDDSPPDTHRCVTVTQLGIGERCNVGAAACGDGLVCEDGLCVI
ncbi:MAG: hypothetical protein QF464_16120, partial [Myxococcota bacterium]|nr:hypothetical protein [Myxococcota bacterium]